MWFGRKRAGLLIGALVLLIAVMHSYFYDAAAQGESNWLVPDAPTLSKITDVSADPLEAANNVDCSPDSFVQSGQASVQNVCTFMSPLGKVTTSGQLDTGADNFVSLQGPDYHSFFLPTTDESIAYVSLPSSGIGNYVGVYRHLTKASLRKNYDTTLNTYYDITEQPDALISDPATSAPLQIDTPSIAFSANGLWMVANLPHRGLVRVNTTDLTVQLFARPIEPSWFLGVADPALAISDDGQYVAGNTDLFGTGNLNVYDLSTCTDQSNAQPNQEQYCSGKDILHGQSLTGQTIGDGLLAAQPGTERLNHIRFVNDDNIRFSAHYDVTSDTNYKIAEYVATAVGGEHHKLGLLGMGDSYISGQGAFDYRMGTDTADNGCHLSELSYPFILGRQSFNLYNSIACSGAKTEDVNNTNDNYKGQVTDGIKWKDRNNEDQIIQNFNPGYSGQSRFASTYLPQAMLLSVGGDDIGFADIVRSCVAHSDTCYSTYEDRAELANEIDGTYLKLVNTYTTLREQSGGARLYVVGYPQIAMPGGNCGLNVHLNDSEVQFSSDLISYLDGVIQQAAATAGVRYVDVQHAFDGHRLCEPGAKAVNGLTAGNDAGATVLGKTLYVIGTESYHPTVLGYQLLASAIAGKTANLQAPMPTATGFAKPNLDTTAPLLQAVAKTGRPLNQVAYDSSLSDGFAIRGSTKQVTAEATTEQLQPGSRYQVVLHTTPVLLDEGGVSADGSVSTTVKIPQTIEPGYHTLHLYGTNMAGQPVDIQKVIYIAATTADFDGDGVSNAANPCLIVPASQQDTDGDGVDDACDPDITATASMATVTGKVSASASLVPATTMPPNNGATTQASQTPADQSNQAILGQVITAKSVADHTGQQVLATKAAAVFRLDWLAVLAVGAGITTVVYFAGKLLYRLKR